VPSANYGLLEEAMHLRKPVFCVYRGYPREVCPVVLGHSQDQETALTFQFAGESKSGLPTGGDWRCLSLSEVSKVELRDGPWRSGSNHSRRQVCVEVVDPDVNPASPYRPKRRLSKRSK
jgi:hypothetical protein